MTEEREEYLDNLVCLADMAEDAAEDVIQAIRDVAGYERLSAKRTNLLEAAASQFEDARADLLAVLEGFAKDIDKANDR